MASTTTVVYDGTPKPVAISMTPSSLATTVVITYNGSETAPSAVGTYTVVATRPGNDNQNVSTASGVLNILPRDSVPGFDLLRVTTSLAISDNNPSIGGTLTASFTLKNTNAFPLVFDNVGVANRCYASNNDFGWESQVTLGAGAERVLSFNRLQTCLGSNFAWISYRYAGVFYGVLPLQNQ